MLFNSREFIIFFVIVWTVYTWLRPRLRLQNAWLLASSYLFYGWWDIRFLYLFIVTTLIDYSIALMIKRGRLTSAQSRTVWLFAITSCFFLVVTQWSAVEFQWNQQFLPTASVDWSRLFSSRLGWWVLAGTISVLALAHPAAAFVRRWPAPTQRQILLATSITANLGILCFFKYFNFFSENFAVIWTSLWGVAPSDFTLNVVLPVGISFYTFQTMSYTIDVYHGDLEASETYLEFATFLALFPQLVAGPIERASHLLPQVQRPRSPLTAEMLRDGLWLIAWGLYKKMIIADNLAGTVNQIFQPFDNIHRGGPVPPVPTDGLSVWVAVIAFAFQIYGDFSGYTDVARGTAKILGFDIMLNFNLPYFATTPAMFWRRWHISLSTWLRDYLYISLGGNRHGEAKTYRNLMATMLLGGFWHGARWNFVLWGAYHGSLLCIYRALGLEGERRGKISRLKHFGMWLLMFVFTLIGWLLFRAQNAATIGAFLQSMFFSPHVSERTWEYGAHLFRFGWFLVLFQILQWRTGDLFFIHKLHWFWRLNIWIFVLMSLLSLTTGIAQEFIYFDF